MFSAATADPEVEEARAGSPAPTGVGSGNPRWVHDLDELGGDGVLGLNEFSRVVSQLHAAPARPGSWDTAIADLTGLLDATGCTVALGAGPDRSILSTSIGPEAITAYTSYYHEQDFVMESCESGPVGVLRGGVFADRKGTEFYADWQQRFDMTDGLFVRLSVADPSTFIVSAPSGDHPYGTSERVKFVNALVPHLRQALSTRQTLLDIDVSGSGIHPAATIARHGFIVVGHGGRVVYMNAAAQRCIAAGDGLHVHHDRVQARTASADDELQAALAHALVRRNLPVRVSSYLVCERDSGKRPYVLSILPLDADQDPRLARAAIVVVDPELDIKPPKTLLRKVFGLTDTESEVALRMLSGEEPKAIADSTSVSIATIRTHLHRIYHKTGTRRQADLIRLLVTIIP